MDDKHKTTIHPILVNSSHEAEDLDFYNQPMRPRANTDPVSPKPRLNLKVRFDLPDIIVDETSDREDSPELREKANTEEGAFFVFTSPPRQRSNTCPVGFYRRSKHKDELRVRPPTPPPDTGKSSSKDNLVRHSSREKVSFSPHRLTKVSEDASEQRQGSPTLGGSRGTSSFGEHDKRGTNADSRASRSSGRVGRVKGLQDKSSPPTSSPKRTAKGSNSGGSAGSHHRTATSHMAASHDVIHSTA